MFFFIKDITKNLLEEGAWPYSYKFVCILQTMVWSEALWGKRDRRNVAYWYRNKMQTNKMLSKAFNFALNIDRPTRSTSE